MTEDSNHIKILIKYCRYGHSMIGRKDTLCSSHFLAKEDRKMILKPTPDCQNRPGPVYASGRYQQDPLLISTPTPMLQSLNPSGMMLV